MSNSEPGPNTIMRRRWEEWAMKSTAIFAVVAALSSGQWGASNLRAILEQGKVDDGWSYYQAKSIKGHLAEHMKSLAAAMAVDHPAAPGQESALVKYSAEMEKESHRLAADKEKIEAEVRGYERSRDDFVERSFWFEIAFACLQAGVVLCTVAAASRKKGLYIAAIVAGALGALFIANGMGHFVQSAEYAKKLGPKMEIQDPLKQPK